MIPSDWSFDRESVAPLSLELAFTHPMAGGPAMETARPVRFGVLVGGRTLDLGGRLERRQAGGRTAWRASYTPEEPGDHVFLVEPAPYWEPAEGRMIVHYTKVVVEAFGGEHGWDAPAGLPVEIEPLVRPYGLWTGNLFRGLVRRNGVPVPFAEVEVEYRGGGRIALPAPAFETQVVKADSAGVFAYAMPRAGWWGFAALVDGDAPMKNPDGVDVPVELGGLIWVHATDMPKE